MIEHAPELVYLLAAVVVGLGGVLIAILTWLGGLVWRRLGEIADLLRAIERDLRADLSGLDRRVAVIEGRCGACVNQNGGQGHG